MNYARQDEKQVQRNSVMNCMLDIQMNIYVEMPKKIYNPN